MTTITSKLYLTIFSREMISVLTVLILLIVLTVLTVLTVLRVDCVDCVDCFDCIVLIKNLKKYLSVCYNFKSRCACTSKNMVCFGLTLCPGPVHLQPTLLKLL